MSMIGVDYGVLNQKGSPSWFSDIYANIPTAGYKGRMFISIDTYAFYRDTGTGWDLIGGPGTGTITGSGISGQVSYFNGSSTLAGSNNLFWNNTNSRLGINTATPGVPLDIHGSGTLIQVNGTGVGNGLIAYQQAGATKWTAGNFFDGAINTFAIYNTGLVSNALTINISNNNTTFSGSLFVNNGWVAIKENIGTANTSTYLTLNASSTGSTIESLILGLSAGTIMSLNFPTSSNYGYTFPSSSGTLALTSNLSSYLPLAGGTLTGTLNGTSANFSGICTINSTLNAWVSGFSVLQIGQISSFWNSDVNYSGIGNNVYYNGTFYKYLINGFANKFEIGNGTFTWEGAPSGTAGNNIAFTEYMRLNTTGNLGINTTTIGSKIQVNGNAAIGYSSSTAAPSNGLVISGNTLIGTTTDSGSKLQVIGTASVNGPVSAYSTSGQYIEVSSGGAAGTSGSPLPLSINFTGYLGNICGQIKVNEISGSAQVSNMYFYTYFFGQLLVMTLTQQGTVNVASLGTGLVYSNAGVLTSTNPSDERLKENINDINWGLNDILKIRPVSYNWKDDKINQGIQFGFIAQEVQKVMPEAIKEFKEEDVNYLGLEKDAIYVTLIKAIQELNEKLVRNNIN